MDNLLKIVLCVFFLAVVVNANCQDDEHERVRQIISEKHLNFAASRAYRSKKDRLIFKPSTTALDTAQMERYKRYLREKTPRQLVIVFDTVSVIPAWSFREPDSVMRPQLGDAKAGDVLGPFTTSQGAYKLVKVLKIQYRRERSMDANFYIWKPKSDKINKRIEQKLIRLIEQDNKQKLANFCKRKNIGLRGMCSLYNDLGREVDTLFQHGTHFMYRESEEVAFLAKVMADVQRVKKWSFNVLIVPEKRQKQTDEKN